MHQSSRKDPTKYIYLFHSLSCNPTVASEINPPEIDPSDAEGTEIVWPQHQFHSVAPVELFFHFFFLFVCCEKCYHYRPLGTRSLISLFNMELGGQGAETESNSVDASEPLGEILSLSSRLCVYNKISLYAPSPTLSLSHHSCRGPCAFTV